MVRRLYVEKKDGFDVAARQLLHEAHSLLGMPEMTAARILCRYDVEGIAPEAMEKAIPVIFSEPNVDNVYMEEMPAAGGKVLAVEYLPGQYDLRADSAEQCLQLLTGGERPNVKCATIYIFEGDVSEDRLARMEKHLINPVESRRASLDKKETLAMVSPAPEDVKTVDGFISLGDAELAKMVAKMGFAMSAEDLRFCRDYFKAEEKRDPTVTELRAIDTYWSDHCRHTTFLTSIDEITFEDGKYAKPVKEAYSDYLLARAEQYRGKERPQTLMDMATLGVKVLKRRGMLPDLDESEEINACSIKIMAKIDGSEEPWLVMFKNETHNHPTEIEPFGGAATCLGGAIRDPLSGRSYVYQAMRISGAGDPRAEIKDTRAGKLPQRQITRKAAQGFSSYGNQIGLAAGKVQEVYHPGFVAKRMELGAVVGAAPEENVRRERPESGDIIVLLGGRTGRDGCGGATGSSKAHTTDSLSTCGAEVQKGNPPTERSIQRLFRKKEFARLIKRCNDFGAGGVSVAIGELAPGLTIDLDKVPKKYEGLDGTELAISESQERMACVIEKKDVGAFLKMADEENLEATVVAVVTKEERLRMTWRGKTIVDLSRAFLDSNGATQHTKAFVEAPKDESYLRAPVSSFDKNKSFAENLVSALSALNLCSQKGLVERFDGSIGTGTVIAPYGGKYCMTPNDAMAGLLPVMGAKTATVMAHGYDPELASWSPYHGAVYAIVESLSKIAAAGGDVAKVRMTFQEYFQRVNKDAEKWGQPAAALLGALKAQLSLGLASIGGKDSMSGTFEDIHVPPTLVAFSLCCEDADKLISCEYKAAGHDLLLLRADIKDCDLPDYDKLLSQYKSLYSLIQSGKVYAAEAVGYGGIAAASAKAAFGNRVGVKLCGKTQEELFTPIYGSVILEVEKGFCPCGYEKIGETTASGFAASGSEVSLSELQSAWEAPLEKVFPTKAKAPAGELSYKPYEKRGLSHSSLTLARPRVYIPAFPGTNCEMDSAWAFRRAGAEAEIGVFRNLTPSAVEESVMAMAEQIKKSQIVMFPGGFSAGDEPDGSGKFIATVLRAPRVRDAIMELIEKRDGLILGICNGFQALVKVGLLPGGTIRDLTESDPTLTFNSINRHAATVVHTVVSSQLSPWLMGVKCGDVHAIPISHGEGRFVCSDADARLLQARGQICFQYSDADGNVSAEMPYNPNGSVYAIEGICSPDGRILGKMGHSERRGENINCNIPGNSDQKLFESGVRYFG
ncbi:MAG: phosphoribosylformylglycinamidine synthase [Eubacteriales bacterium]|nr:phosphoribosylformylglycinamidine synthase [Eubacteriales bacterium]MDD3881176.1 phosphoribosylformylglycinamidine synthase [Eubacteriales bacterium]MDD4511558.1 phosphoribosylformylglycinamidine synthase [Eubacteriales bacterium]